MIPSYVVANSTTLPLRLLIEEIDCYQESWAAGGGHKDVRVHGQQLEYLSAGARNLEEVVESRKELILDLERFEANLSQ